MGLTENIEGNNFYPKYIPEVDWHCDYLWSTNRGCSFDCVYCSSKRFNVRFGGDPAIPRRLKGEWADIGGVLDPIRLTRLLPSRSIFVNPYCDMFSLSDWEIKEILHHISDEMTRHQNPNMSFIFQTKAEYFDYLDLIPEGSWLGTTIETNEYSQWISNAPSPYDRYIQMTGLRDKIKRGYLYGCKLFVTIEPAMIESCKVLSLYHMIKEIKPELVFVGCGTGEITYPEPTRGELIALIEELKKITHVHVKNNAQRIIGDADSQDWFKVTDMKGE